MARHRANQDWKLWSYRAAKDALNRAGYTDTPWTVVHVRYVFHYPRKTHADPDNLVGSAKPVLDALRGVLLSDDSHEHVHRISAGVEVDKQQPAGLRVEVERCECPR